MHMLVYMTMKSFGLVSLVSMALHGVCNLAGEDLLQFF